MMKIYWTTGVCLRDFAHAKLPFRLLLRLFVSNSGLLQQSHIVNLVRILTRRYHFENFCRVVILGFCLSFRFLKIPTIGCSIWTKEPTLLFKLFNHSVLHICHFYHCQLVKMCIMLLIIRSVMETLSVPRLRLIIITDQHWLNQFMRKSSFGPYSAGNPCTVLSIGKIWHQDRYSIILL